MRNQAIPTAQANARVLRTAMTDSERKLWRGLRMEQLGVKFRRQHPLGNYIADFACLGPKLIVELDGSQHADQSAYDGRRDEFFRSQGFAVLRFPSNEPFLNLDGVLAVIAGELIAAAGRLPPSQPSPGGGRSEHSPAQEHPPSQPSPGGGRSEHPPAQEHPPSQPSLGGGRSRHSRSIS